MTDAPGRLACRVHLRWGMEFAEHSAMSAGSLKLGACHCGERK
jgi:hypothetical protein